MPKAKKAATPKKQKLTPEQRSQIAKDRWAKRRATEKAPESEITTVTWPESNIVTVISNGPVTARSGVVIPSLPEPSVIVQEGLSGEPITKVVEDRMTETRQDMENRLLSGTPAPQLAPVAPKRVKRASVPREFLLALKTADKRLADAIEEYEDCQRRITYLERAIPRLQRTVLALRNESDPDAYPPAPAVPASIPNAGVYPIPLQPPPQFNLSPNPLAALQAAMPTMPAPRAQGGAIQFGAEVTGALEGPEDDDPDKFLTGPNAGGGWIGG